ncbi:sensor histidine kinase [Nocardioides panacisoli]|uniref:sensor histidine kinase n=1 Tax=Nocardioides panacisoli TaxID=627624 RepID=UPI001C6314F5|nr:sensor histidine kinase [Nocardioides panacisoli]QYJ04192.1 sensor histidine kinase [Nocardioides panacisoli]
MDTTIPQRLSGFFALDDDWERRGGVAPRDWVVGGAMFVVAMVMLELVRSVGGLTEVDEPRWVQWLAVASGAALLVLRRRWPLVVALLASAHMFVIGLWMPEVMAQLSLQIVYFVAIFSGVAWARSRRHVAVVVGAIVLFMFAWLAWMFALGTWVDDFRANADLDGERPGPLGPVTAGVLITSLVNLLYFGGAVIGGQVAWRSARQRADLADQAATIAEQSDQLQRHAVVEERLRIARELHDVVAHHVSVIGIQAAAGRRVLGRDEAAVAEALGHVEASSREAVDQMRSLVGTLRDPSRTGGDGPDESRAPEPTLRDVAALIAASNDHGLTVDYDVVADTPEDLERLPAALGNAVHRTVQEALTNVRRHSTADHATVVLRIVRAGRSPYAEVEVTDNGRPRVGSTGSGLGLLGVRERVAAVRGEVEIGPRAVGGFRVRVRLPLTSADAGRDTASRAVQA